MVLLVALMILYGSVIGSHGCVYVDSHNFQLLYIHPNDTVISKALRMGDGLLGMTYASNTGKPSITLAFKVNPKRRYALIYKSYSTIRNPLRLGIYISSDAKKWHLVKIDIADNGTHKILLPIAPKLVKLVGVNSKLGGMGASLFDTVYLTEVSGNLVTYKFDLEHMQICLGGVWISIFEIPLLLLSSFIGVSVFVEDKRSRWIIATIVTFIPTVIYLVLNLSMYIISGSLSSLIMDNFIFGIIGGFFFSKVFQKST